MDVSIEEPVKLEMPRQDLTSFDNEYAKYITNTKQNEDRAQLFEQTEFDLIWQRFTEFEEYQFEEDMGTFTAFLTEWQKRLTLAMEAGLTYSETVLSLKLLRNSRLDNESRTKVFLALQTRPDYMQANLLLFTLSALNKMKREKEGDKTIVKTETHEDLKLKKLQMEEKNKDSESDLDLNEGEADDDESRNAFKCSDCPMTCPRLQEFQRHVVCHQGPARLHACNHCSASFDKQSALGHGVYVSV